MGQAFLRKPRADPKGKLFVNTNNDLVEQNKSLCSSDDIYLDWGLIPEL